MSNNLEVKFTNSKNEIQPIIVLAGKNGTGKTTLLEYIYQNHILNIGAFYQDSKNYIKIFENQKIKILDNSAEKYKKEIKDFQEQDAKKNGISAISIDDKGFYLDELNKYIVYIPARTPNGDEINSLNELVMEYINYIIYEEGLTAIVAYENLQNDIDEIFEDFGLSFQFKKIDSKNKKVLFEPYVSTRDDIEFSLESLSTGEKTLLFKVLNLYLQKAKNKIILIDEPELSLHPFWQNRVLSVYEKFAQINNNQIIIATHSPHIISSAKSDYLRVIYFDDNQTLKVQNHIDYSYGLEVDKILTEIMGLDYTRTPKVAGKIAKLWEYLEDEDYESKEFLNIYNELENILGSLDKELVLARLEIAKLKAENA